MNTKAERQAENVINLVRGSDHSRKKMALSLLIEWIKRVVKHSSLTHCPRCGSENIVEWEDRRYHCMDCGKEFKG